MHYFYREQSCIINFQTQRVKFQTETVVLRQFNPDHNFTHTLSVSPHQLQLLLRCSGKHRRRTPQLRCPSASRSTQRRRWLPGTPRRRWRRVPGRFSLAQRWHFWRKTVGITHQKHWPSFKAKLIHVLFSTTTLQLPAAITAQILILLVFYSHRQSI